MIAGHVDLRINVKYLYTRVITTGEKDTYLCHIFVVTHPDEVHILQKWIITPNDTRQGRTSQPRDPIKCKSVGHLNATNIDEYQDLY